MWHVFGLTIQAEINIEGSCGELGTIRVFRFVTQCLDSIGTNDILGGYFSYSLRGVWCSSWGEFIVQSWPNQLEFQEYDNAILL